MISIGAVLQGPELEGTRIQDSIRSVSRAIREIRGPLREGVTPWVNAVFVVEGSLGKPNSDYLEYGDYSRSTKGIVVQIPVRNHIVQRDEHMKFLIEELHGANAMAFEFFRQKKGEEFPLREAEALVLGVAEHLGVEDPVMKRK